MKCVGLQRAKVWAGWIVYLISGATFGQAVPEALKTCASEPDNARRLQCYDREVAKLPVAAKYSAHPRESQPAAVARGASSTTPPPSAPIAATIVALHERPHAGFVVTLDNGEVWAQNQMEPAHGITVGDRVTIKPGAFGSFWLVAPSGWATKAHRVQ